MTDQEKNKDGEGAIGLEILKELTIQFMELRRVVANWTNTVQAKGEQDAAILDAVESLDGTMTGMNLMLSRMMFVFDRLVDVKRGNPEAEPPAEPRAPTLEDVAAALEEFDAATEITEEEEPEPTPPKPEKAAMLYNKPGKKLPPLPKVEPLPK